MTKEEFLKCVGGVDDDLIENVPVLSREDEADYIRSEDIKTTLKHKGKFLKYIVAAACIVVVVGIGIAFKMVSTDESTRVAENNTAKITEQSVTGKAETASLPGTLAYNNLEFCYNNKNYKVINDKAFLYTNNLTSEISKTDVGKSLEKNILDTSGNNVLGDVYSYKNSSNEDIVILRTNDGSYNFAFSEDNVESNFQH